MTSRPSHQAEFARGERFVDPSVEPLGDFLLLNGENVVPARSATSPAANFIIDEIDLASEAHRHRRRRCKLVMTAIATLEAKLLVYRRQLGNSPGPQLEAEIAAAENELAVLASDFGASPPWDMPEWCHCDSR